MDDVKWIAGAHLIAAAGNEIDAGALVHGGASEPCNARNAPAVDAVDAARMRRLHGFGARAWRDRLGTSLRCDDAVECGARGARTQQFLGTRTALVRRSDGRIPRQHAAGEEQGLVAQVARRIRAVVEHAQAVAPLERRADAAADGRGAIGYVRFDPEAKGLSHPGKQAGNVFRLDAVLELGARAIR